MSKPGRVLGLLGSLREDSISARALAIVRQSSECNTITWKVFDPRLTPLPLCDGRGPTNPYPDVVETLRNAVRNADCVVFATPAYNGTYSAVVKNMVELLGPDFLFRKIAGVVAVSAEDSASAAAANLASLLQHCGCWVVPILARLPYAESVLRNMELPRSRSLILQFELLGKAIAASCRERCDP